MASAARAVTCVRQAAATAVSQDSGFSRSQPQRLLPCCGREEAIQVSCPLAVGPATGSWYWQWPDVLEAQPSTTRGSPYSPPPAPPLSLPPPACPHPPPPVRQLTFCRIRSGSPSVPLTTFATSSSCSASSSRTLRRQTAAHTPAATGTASSLCMPRREVACPLFTLPACRGRVKRVQLVPPSRMQRPQAHLTHSGFRCRLRDPGARPLETSGQSSAPPSAAAKATRRRPASPSRSARRRP